MQIFDVAQPISLHKLDASTQAQFAALAASGIVKILLAVRTCHARPLTRPLYMSATATATNVQVYIAAPSRSFYKAVYGVLDFKIDTSVPLTAVRERKSGDAGAAAADVDGDDDDADDDDNDDAGDDDDEKLTAGEAGGDED
jgi:hypothetical protein